MKELFSGEPTGSLDFPDTQEILGKILVLEQEITILKDRISKLENHHNE